MRPENRANLLRVISDLQESTASVTVQIGGQKDNGMVENDTLYIKECPSRITSELAEMGYSLSVTEDGVEVIDF